MNVLIIGHNPFNKELPNGRTLYELFSQFSSNNLAEIFFHPDEANFEVCSNYYRITDTEMLKRGIFHKSVGKIVKNDNEFSGSNRSEVYKHGSKRKSYMVFARNAIWKIGRWYTKELHNWIKNFKPDIIFLYLGNYCFSIDVALRISKKFNIPIVTYIVDDYYFNNNLRNGFFGKMNQNSYNKLLVTLLNNRTSICLNEFMMMKYSEAFRGDFHTIYTVSSLSAFEENPPRDILKMSYLGGIACGRHQSIMDIASVIQEEKLPIEFTVYTRDNREWILDQIKETPGVRLASGISYEKVQETMSESDILVHVEGFSKENQELVRYSLSTKIADTLSCNRCLVAYGPNDIASIEYLKAQNCSYVATSLDELRDILRLISFDRESVNKYTSVALSVAQSNHSRQANHQKLIHILQKVIDESKKGKF